MNVNQVNSITESYIADIQGRKILVIFLYNPSTCQHDKFYMRENQSLIDYIKTNSSQVTAWMPDLVVYSFHDFYLNVYENILQMFGRLFFTDREEVFLQ